MTSALSTDYSALPQTQLDLGDTPSSNTHGSPAQMMSHSNHILDADGLGQGPFADMPTEVYIRGASSSDDCLALHAP